MEKNKLTKELLAQSFHDLMLHREFEKITIKNITDEAGVIRPTFYYHFQDKYDVLEYILRRDIIEKAEEMSKMGMEREAIKFVFSALERDREFYRRAFQVTGQNSFEEMFQHYAYEMWKEKLESAKLIQNTKNQLLNEHNVAMYYALGITASVKMWLENGKGEVSADELCEAYEFLLTHSIFDLIKMK
ncbi:MAG: TetR/AcrR family transcriptional regulator C-terminal domain-containing protein [Lachnospiraceae bacterium]|nr:TetR/AcrR family transcriptional regulator C-terminal domain-containing protein [Lachnospiraceae bacterium]